MTNRTPKFRLAAIAAGVFTVLGQMLAGPSGRAAQFGRIDVGDEKLDKALDAIESSIGELAKKAKGEYETLGKTTKDTLDALDKVGKDQRELADRLLKMEQAGTAKKDDEDADTKTWGAQVTQDPKFKSWAEGSMSKVRFELNGEGKKVKNTLLGTPGVTDPLVAPDRRTGIIPGPYRNLLLEQYLQSADTTSNAIQFTRENTFTNAAAETAEGAQKPESSITFSLVTQPVQNVAHWIKVSRQLSMDAPALMAYINNRMRYGVNKRVEDQIISGNGVDPNISGLLKSGNFTAHGYTAASLGAVNPVLKLIRRIIADLSVSNYPADIVILNPSDWADIELTPNTQNNYIFGGPQADIPDSIWRTRVLATNAIPAGTVIVMSRMAATVYNREGVVVEMSESDADNFTKNLITLRAERRVMLAVEIPAAIRAGVLAPA